MIDFHTHLGKSSKGENYTAEDLIAYLDRYNIEKAGLSCLNNTDTRVLNDFVNECYKKYPDRIIPFAYINPRETFAVDEVRRTLGEFKFKAVKFHSWKCGYYPDNNSNLDKVIDVIEEFQVPILTHTGTPPLSLPSQWAMVAKRHPNVNFIFAHIGYYDYGYGCVEMAKELPNVYVDTAGQYEIPILEKALEDLKAERIIFGTDWPYKPVDSELAKFNVLNLTEEEKKLIFGENAKKLLRL